RGVYQARRPLRVRRSHMVSGGGLEPHTPVDCDQGKRPVTCGNAQRSRTFTAPRGHQRTDLVHTVHTGRGIMADMARSVEPYTTRRGEQRFKVRYRLGTRQTSRTFTTHAGAREFARLLDTLGPAEADRILQERIAAPDDTHTFGAFATHHIDTITGVQPDTRDRYRAYLRNDLTDLAPLPLTAITDKAIGRWVQRLEAAGASGKTIKNKHGFLSAVLDRAVA